MIQQTNQDSQTSLQVLNSEETGVEVVNPTDIIPSSPALEKLLAPMRDGTDMLIHEQILLNTIPDPAMREKLVDAYMGMEPVSFKKFAGKRLLVYGMILFEVAGGWNGKPTTPGGPAVYHPEGYFQVRILAEDDKGTLVLIKSSGKGVAHHVAHILNNRGWYLFSEPIEYEFLVGEDNGHRILNTSNNLKSVLKAGKAGK